jgi:hypothetical protein
MSHEHIDTKGEIQQAEDAGKELGLGGHDAEAVRGDAALKIAAEERIDLTEEDVS